MVNSTACQGKCLIGNRIGAFSVLLGRHAENLLTRLTHYPMGYVVVIYTLQAHYGILDCLNKPHRGIIANVSR